MLKFLSRFLAMVLFMSIGLTSCSDDDDNGITVPEEAPNVSVSLETVSRTEVSFTITADNAVDYAYMIVPTGETISSAEELFKVGDTGMLKDNKISISCDDVAGGAEYTLYTAVRKINPYTYSELVATPLNTDIAYTQLITMDAIGLTSYTYHIELPQGASHAQHVSVMLADYDAISRILAGIGIKMTPASYLKTFGTKIDSSCSTTVDKYGETAQGDAINVYSDLEYMIIAGLVSDDGNLIESSVEILNFKTKKAAVSPYNITVDIANVTSTAATVSVTPDEGFVSYRALIDTRAEFDYAESEGTIDGHIIGEWSDESRMYTEPHVFDLSGLVPNTNYVIGIIGFDAENRQKKIILDFDTTEPTGPAPEITIEEANPEGLKNWCEGAATIKVKHASLLYAVVTTKATFDEVLSRPGVTAADIIVNNGTQLTDEDVAQALSAEGLLYRTADNLSANTAYTIGIYARNEEYLVSAQTYTFTTGSMPQQGGETRSNLPGTYTATTTDIDGNAVTFPVTIATGVNDATTSDYSSKNRLVCLGFGPESSEYPYTSPTQLIAAGASEEDANLNYGPKWFIEFGENDEIYVPAAVNSSYAFDYNMCKSGDNTLYFWGFARNPRTDRIIGSGSYNYPVTVSDDYNTVTIEAYSVTSFGSTFTYYPAMTITSSTWSDGTPVFQTSDKIVLTRNNRTNAAAKSVRGISLKTPKHVKINVGIQKKSNDRLNAAAERITK